MKHHKIIHVAILIMLLAPACRRDSFPPPMNFQGYEGNPILVPGEPGSWDDLYVITANVVEDKDTIYLFYLGYSQAGSRALGVATSTDGFHFVKYNVNPILQGDGEGYDAFGVGQGSSR